MPPASLVPERAEEPTRRLGIPPPALKGDTVGFGVLGQVEVVQDGCATELPGPPPRRWSFHLRRCLTTMVAAWLEQALVLALSATE